MIKLCVIALKTITNTKFVGIHLTICFLFFLDLPSGHFEVLPCTVKQKAAAVVEFYPVMLKTCHLIMYCHLCAILVLKHLDLINTYSLNSNNVR